MGDVARWSYLLNHPVYTSIDERMFHMVRRQNQNAGETRWNATGRKFLSFSNENKEWVKNGYELFQKESGVTIGIFGSADHWDLVIRVLTSPPRFGLAQIKRWLIF